MQPAADAGVRVTAGEAFAIIDAPLGSALPSADCPAVRISLRRSHGLIAAFNLRVPLPDELVAIGQRRSYCREGRWRILTPRYRPDGTVHDHHRGGCYCYAMNADTVRGGPVIVFDAMCVLCSANAQFVLRWDRAGKFRLASMQGEVGASLYFRFGIDPGNPESLVVVDGGRALRDSEAIFAICRGLGWPWRAACVLRLVPRTVRDPVYRWVARNRYRIFGRRETCWVPTREQANRVL